MTVRHLQPAAECAVDDGGVWGRDGVWLSGDGRTLVSTESSGLLIDAGVPVRRTKRVPLDAACRPEAAAKTRR